MLLASILGVWYAIAAPAAANIQWVPPLNQTAHYFFVVYRASDGVTRAFVRNPEFNAGVFLGTRTLQQAGNIISLRAADSSDVTGTQNADGTVTLDGFPTAQTSLTFHRPAREELQWYYPRPNATWQYHRPPAGNDGWTTGTLAGAGMNEASLAPLMNQITAERAPTLRSPYIHSVSIARHGLLVLDEYFYGFSSGQPHDVRSAGKSVTTLLVGRASEETHAFSPESTILDLLSRYQPVKNDDARKRRITVANLMTMSSGLACDDNDDDSPGNEDRMQSQTAQPDWYRYTLDLPMASDPGTRAIYCTAAINLLGAIVANATGAPLTHYFFDRFASPMQFERYAMWLMPGGTREAYMGGGDEFRPRDFLKFGQLFLSHGAWDGRKIVDDAWLQASIVPRTEPEGEGDRYGYGWHLTTLRVEGRSYQIVNAGGNGGQLLVIVPALDMTIMIAAGNYNQYPVWRSFLPDVTTAAIRSCLEGSHALVHVQ